MAAGGQPSYISATRDMAVSRATAQREADRAPWMQPWESPTRPPEQPQSSTWMVSIQSCRRVEALLLALFLI